MADRQAMPARSTVDPMFDGHLDRSLLDLTVDERLDWIWTAMQLLRLGAAERAARADETAKGKTPTPPG